MQNHNASFRDPSGFIIKDANGIKRVIQKSYEPHYIHLMQSGLYQALVKQEALVKHTEINNNSEFYKTISPEYIPFISYPYEWCFEQYYDAALLTLQVMQTAIDYGMILKDASAYNIQWRDGKPILIDTLSFEIYEENTPWIAYNQFCKHFLAPLLLMSKVDESLNSLMIGDIDGVDLTLATKLLPYSEKFHLSSFMHIYMHAKSIKKYQNQQRDEKTKSIKFVKQDLVRLVLHLQSAIVKLKLQRKKSQWSAYYKQDVNEAEYLTIKTEKIEQWLKDNKGNMCWDAGCNTGVFSIIASKYFNNVVATDYDKTCIAALYNRKVKNILPLCLNIVQPSPNIGWYNTERETIWQRLQAHTTLALALIHHLVITHQITFEMCASMFSQHTQNLIIEWVEPHDEKCKFLLGNNEIRMTLYNHDNFKNAFSTYFEIYDKQVLKNGLRILYYMKKRNE